VVQIIDDIADQTNLLALNAAIEAARAGEHGKGFAVVANEVRKLAERSSRETKQISELIKQVQAATQNAVDAMEAGALKVDQGTARADLARQVLGEILAAVDNTVQRVTEIAASAPAMAASSRGVVDAMYAMGAVVEENMAATEEMSAQAAEVDTAISSIASVSETQRASTEDVSASTEQMSTQMLQMSTQARSLAATAQLLKNMVSQFELDDEAPPKDNVTPLRRAA
jgi:methyl-accepting chemotaxis protein